MELNFKIGDLVKPTLAYKKERKHTASQCKLGVIIDYNSRDSLSSIECLFKVYWWPHNAYFFFPSQSLELVSRALIDVKNSSLDDIAAELQDKADNI